MILFSVAASVGVQVLKQASEAMTLNNEEKSLQKKNFFYFFSCSSFAYSACRRQILYNDK